MNVAIKKDGGEIVLDENCCTAMVILLKNDGNMATSFYGYHNAKLIKIMTKAQKKYFKSLKKRLKTESEEDNIVIKSEDIPQDQKWENNEIEEKLDENKSGKDNEKNTSLDIDAGKKKIDNKKTIRNVKNNTTKKSSIRKSTSNKSTNNPKK